NFVPLGMSFHLLHRDADAERFSAFSTVDRHRESVIELTLPWVVLPGEGRLVVTDAGRELAHIVISELEDGLLIPVETRDWAAGTVGLRLDYVREGETVTIEEKAMPVGVIKVS